MECMWEDSTDKETDQYIYAYFIACGIATVLINLFVFYIALRYVDLRAKPNQIFVVSMTVADMLFGFIFMITRPFASCFPTWLCGPYYIALWGCQMGSVLFLFLLNIDKFIAIRLPLHYNRLVTERMILSQAILVWTIIGLLTSFSYFGPFMKPGQNCIRFTFDPALYYVVLFTFLAYTTPLLVSFIISIYIFIIAQTASRTHTSEHRDNRRLVMKRILFVFSSTMWTSFTFLPYRVGYGIFNVVCTSMHIEPTQNTLMANVTNFNMTTTVGPPSICDPSYSYAYTLIEYMYYVIPLGALGNPIVTIVTQRTYRLPVFNIWSRCARFLHLPSCCHPSAVRRSDTLETSTQAESVRLRSLEPTIGSRSSTGRIAFDVI